MWLSSKIRPYNEGSLQSQIPPQYVEELKLQHRDLVFWKREEDGTFKVKLVKLEEVAE
jgi:hypothetical protein